MSYFCFNHGNVELPLHHRARITNINLHLQVSDVLTGKPFIKRQLLGNLYIKLNHMWEDEMYFVQLNYIPRLLSGQLGESYTKTSKNERNGSMSFTSL
ncbi:MAG: hypothetical protein ACTS4V_00025 [Candidatus Hodgkinia cicadicola]